jgi:hypothetical protein
MFVKLGALPGVYDSGEKFSDVLAYNHYGTETIPPRPVLRIAAERLSQKFVKERLEEYLSNVVEYSKRGRMQDVKRAEVVFLQDLGRQAVKEAKRIIEAGGELQHNAPSTIAKKGEGKPPLKDTGELEKKLSYEVSND